MSEAASRRARARHLHVGSATKRRGLRRPVGRTATAILAALATMTLGGQAAFAGNVGVAAAQRVAQAQTAEEQESPTTREADPAPPPPDPSDPPRWWQRIRLAIGPGIVTERASGQGTSDDLTVDVAIINGSRRAFLPFGLLRGLNKAGFTPAVRLSIRPRQTSAVDTLQRGARSFGHISLRPLMGGVRWSHGLSSNLSVELFGVAGYSFNSFDVNDNDERPGDEPRVVLPAAVASVDDSVAWEMGGKIWVDLHPRVALTTGASFMRTKPQVTLIDGSRRPWDGSRVRMEAGVVFAILKGR